MIATTTITIATHAKENRGGYSEYKTRRGVKRFGNYGWVLRDVKKVYPTSHAKSNPIRGTVATTFQHTRTHSIHRDTNHQNSPARM